MVMNKIIKRSLIFLVLLIFAIVFIPPVISEDEIPPVDDPPAVVEEDPPAEGQDPPPEEEDPPADPDPEPEPDPEPGSLHVTKKLVGDIWHVRCDYMDGETFVAGGGIWKRDVIKNPDGILSKEGHRSNKCGDAEHWVIWVGADGVPYRMDEIKSGSTGGTLPTVIYRPRYDLSDDEIMNLSPYDPDMVWKYSQNFIDVMSWSDIQIGQRIYWTTQNGNQVWYHTGIPYKSTPTFILYINGTGYPLIAGESVEISDLLPGIYEISEEGSAEYYLGEVTSDGEITSQNEWTVTIQVGEGQDVSVEWPNVVKTPPPKDPPDPPSPPEVPTATPTPAPDETPPPTPTPTPTPSPTPSPSPTPVVELEGYKIWDDAEDLEHLRPVSVLIMLYANGELVRSVEVSASESDENDSMWTYYFGEFPKVDENGEAIDYSILEEPVAGYDSHYRGISVINSHATSTPAPEETDAPTATPTSPLVETPTATPTPTPTPTPKPKPTATPTPSPDPTSEPVEDIGIPEVPEDQPQPKLPKSPFWWTMIEDYETALGILLNINHVGDAFD